MYTTVVEVDLNAIKSNVKEILKHTNVGVVAVVKANAYGHGAVPVAKAAVEAGASMLAVARVEEVAELRKGGLTCPIFLFGRTPPKRLDEMIQQEVSLTVWNAEQIEQAAAAARRVGKIGLLQIKVDTGMGRLGVRPQDFYPLVEKVINTQNVELEGVFTHFARADEIDTLSVDHQQACFKDILATLNARNIEVPFIHASNSAASLCRPDAYYNLVRPGIAIYGMSPSKECPLPGNYKPALTWKAVLSQVKMLPPGHGISYGHIYTTSREERIGVLPLGYADGFRRVEGNQALINGKKVNVVGRVCMDMCMLQLDDVPNAAEGDEVVVIGSQADQRIAVEDIADVWGTVNYEVVCGIGARVPRIYV